MKNTFYLLLLPLLFISCQKENLIKEECIVTFDSQSGSCVSALKVGKGEKVTKPTDPTRDKSSFLGWYKDASCSNVWNFEKDFVEQNLILYAGWKINNISLDAIQFLKIYTNKKNDLTRYTIQRLYNAGTNRITFYERDLEGNKIGSPIYITESECEALSLTLWRCEKELSNGNIVEIMVDNSLITSNYEESTIGFYIPLSYYVQKEQSAIFDFTNSSATLTSLQKESLKAIEYICFYQNEFDKYKFSLQRLYTTGTTIVIYIIDSMGTKIDSISVSTNNSIALGDGRYCLKIKIPGGSFEIIYSPDNIKADYLSLTDRLYFNYSTYKSSSYDDNALTRDKLYCNLGASTSGYAWHPNAAAELEMVWKTFSIGGSAWLCYIGCELDYSDTPEAKNRSMMNQVARIFKDNEDNGYYPNSITLLAGLGDANVLGNAAYTLGTLDEALSVDLTGLTPVNWNTDAPIEWQRNVAINMRACIEFLSGRFPYAQFILMTPYAVKRTSYPTSRLIPVNALIREMGARYSIPVIDFFSECGISDVSGTASLYLLSDGLHPNAAGNALLKQYAVRKLRNTLIYRN